MFAKSLTAGLVGSALLATAAFAQAPSTSTATPMTSTTATNSSYAGNWRTSKVVGLNVYNEGNESLGSISDLLTDKNGKIVAAIIGVGGFLGVGERYVAIPFEKVKFVNEPVKTNTTANSGGSMGAPTTTTTTSSTTTTGAAGTGTGMATTPAATPAAVTPNPWYPDHAVISGTKDELKALPEFKYNNS